MPNYTNFQNVRSIGDAQITEQVTDNMISFLNSGFLSIGAFYNVVHPSSGIFNNPYSTLRGVSYPSFTNGQVWEGFRSNWIWETNVDYSSQPIQISGVYVNNSFVSTGFYVNYPLGQIVFNSPISTLSNVQADFSYRYINVYSSDTEVFRQIQTNSFRSDINFGAGSGLWNIDAQNRVQLPAVFVEAVPNRRDIPKQLGGGLFIEQDIIFHVVSETTAERKRIMDIIANQKEHKIYLYDKNEVAASGAFPLNLNGSLANNNSYVDLVNNYTWCSLYFAEMSTQYITDYIPSIYMGDVRATVEIDYGLGV